MRGKKKSGVGGAQIREETGCVETTAVGNFPDMNEG